MKNKAYASLAAFLVSMVDISHAASATDSNVIEEIVVTARHRSENIQKSPLAISVVSAQQIETRGFSQVSDVSTVVPNVSFQPSGSTFGNAITAYVRGVGQQDTSYFLSPAVGFYMDDVYVGTLTGADFNLADVESIEVLRGPQGTLFGANTESGAVRIRTVKPKGDNSGYLDVGFGSFEHMRVKGAVDLPLIDDELFMRASFISDKQEGFLDRVDFACKHPNLAGTLPVKASPLSGCELGTEGGKDMHGGRVALRWLASEDVEVNLSGEYSRDTSEVPATVLLAVQPSTLANYSNDVTIPTFGIPYDERFVSPDARTSYATYTDPITGFYSDPINPLTSYGFSATVDWTMDSGLHAKSITGYRDNDGSLAVTFGGPLTTAVDYQETRHEQFSQEFTLGGESFSGFLEWTVGAFYYWADSAIDGDIDLPTIGVLPYPVLDLGGGNAIGAENPSGYGLHFLSKQSAIDKNKSAFAHGILHFTDAMSLELGVRYTDQTKTATLNQTLVAYGVQQFPITERESNSKRWDPKISLQYEWNDNLMTYASYATGFKGGGINTRVSTTIDQLTPFDPEEVTSYEIGAKSSWLENRMRLNGAVFLMDYSNLQVQANNAGGLPVLLNSGKSEIKGVELELEALPTENLQINASVGYLDFETTDCGRACQSPTNTDGIPEGGVAPLTPEWKYSLGAQYSIDLGNKGTLSPRIEYIYQSKVYNDISNFEVTAQEGYGLTNFRLIWTGEEEKWSAQASVTNLTDEVYYVNKFNTLNSLGTMTGTPGRPREFMVSVKREF